VADLRKSCRRAKSSEANMRAFRDCQQCCESGQYTQLYPFTTFNLGIHIHADHYRYIAMLSEQFRQSYVSSSPARSGSKKSRRRQRMGTGRR
jgi:hypothetical protein